MNEKMMNANHEVRLVDRSFLSLNGIIKIISFNDEEFLIESTMGNIHIKGNSLDVIKMDTTDGNVKIKGTINSIAYLDSKIKNKEDNIISKLFR